MRLPVHLVMPDSEFVSYPGIAQAKASRGDWRSIEQTQTVVEETPGQVEPAKELPISAQGVRLGSILVAGQARLLAIWLTSLCGHRITKDKTTIERTENSSMSTVCSVANASGRRLAKGDSVQRNVGSIGIVNAPG